MIPQSSVLHVISGIAIGTFLANGMLLALRYRHRQVRALIGLLVGALSAYVLLQHATITPGALTPQATMLVMLASPGPALVWWGGLELLDEPGLARRFLPSLLILFVVAAALGCAWPPAFAALRAAQLALFVHLLLRAWQGGSGDLIETRRRWRKGLALTGAAMAVTVAVAQILVPNPGPSHLPALQGMALIALSLALLTWLGTAGTGLPPTNPAVPERETIALTPAEAAVLTRLERALDGQVWREEGLTLGALARRLDTTEHRLRRAIHVGLGYRNFAAFLNDYRLRAAMAVLADPARADQPIQTLAFDLGYGSPGPFIRAFRDATGTSPSAWRVSQLGRHAPKSE